MHKKIYFLAGFIFTVSLLLAACQTKPAEIITTVIVEKEPQTIVETVIVTVEVAEETPVDPCCDIYRIGLLEEPISLNYWHYLGLGSVWTQYVILDDAAHLFELSDQRFQLVPSLANAIPVPVDKGDGTWNITVEMVPDALWSDGEPITAQDVVFTHNVCVDLALTLVWPFYCAPHGADVSAEALDEFSVQYTFHNQAPSVNTWHAGVALAPILPEHYWAGAAAEAYRIIENVALPEAERPENCSESTVLAGDQEACQLWDAYDQAYEAARNSLYLADASDHPVAGGYRTVEWVPGEYIERVENQHYYFKGAEIIEYQDGTWKRVMPDGSGHQYYGSAEGEETLHFRRGPHNPGVLFTFYDSQETAIDALLAGDIDYLPNPLPLTSEMREKVNQGSGVRTYANTDYDMFYLAFNFLRYPMSEHSFRQAFDILIDKELLSAQVFDSTVEPLYSTMPKENYFWHADVGPAGSGLTRAERLSTAVQILKNAGWSWDTEPTWDEFRQDTVTGVGLRMPDGKYMPETTIIGPGYEYDPQRANYNLLISEWGRDLGMPIKTDLIGRNAILDTVFLDAEYDMYIFGWSLGDPAFPDYYDTFWHSRNCTVDTGGRNAPCFKNEEYDALVDEFLKTSDPARAQELHLQMEILLADQRPYIPLFSEKVFDIASDRVIFPYSDLLGGIEFQAGFQIDAQVINE
jgi:peptide/nickel transport system substrate-binding protein